MYDAPKSWDIAAQIGRQSGTTVQARDRRRASSASGGHTRDANDGDEKMMKMTNDNLNRLRDAKLITDAMRNCPDARRLEFLRRLQRSYRTWGSLTPSMRHALTATSS